MTPPTISGFNITGLVRKSSTLTTWSAVQTSLDRAVTVKVLQAEKAADRRLCERFLEMARTVSKLRHPGIAQIYDVVSDAPQPYVVMEAIEGKSLVDLVTAGGPLTAQVATRFSLQIAEALDHAWTRSQLVLRNLKPQEIRVNAQGQVKLSDFGLAVKVSPGTDPTELDGGHVVGTPQFIAPEQAQLSRTVTCRADMYALGATLYYLVTGRIPFGDLEPAAILARQIDGQLPHPRSITPQLSASLCGVLTRLMMKAPEERYPTWSDVISDLLLVQRNRPLPRRPPPAGISTIGRLDGNAAAKATLKPAKKATATAPTPANDTHGFRTVLWLLLAGWFGWFAWQRLGAPTLWRVDAPATATGRGAEEAEASEAFGQSPAESPPSARQRQPGEADTDSQADETPWSAGQVDRSAASTALPAALLRELRTALLSGNITAARLAVAGPIPGVTPSELDALRDALSRVPASDLLVEAGLMAHRGESIRILYLDREREIVPEAIVAGEIQAEFVDPDGSRRPVVFRTDQFSPAEKLRWLPAATTSGEHAVACILALQAGDRASVMAHAPSTGALAALFADLAETLTP